FFFQAEDGIRDFHVTGVQTCALPICVLPLVLWRQWILQYPEGIPANAWLLNGNGIRFRPAFFRWIFYERLTKLISGYLGIVILRSEERRVGKECRFRMS